MASIYADVFIYHYGPPVKHDAGNILIVQALLEKGAS